MTFDDWAQVEAYALTLPGVEASTSYRQPAVKVDGRLIASTGHEPGSFHLRSPHEEKAVLIATDPATFWQTPHYADSPGLLVCYGSADANRIALVIRRAWWDQMKLARRRGHGERP